jgi:hypothetical protein
MWPRGASRRRRPSRRVARGRRAHARTTAGRRRALASSLCRGGRAPSGPQRPKNIYVSTRRRPLAGLGARRGPRAIPPAGRARCRRAQLSRATRRSLEKWRTRHRLALTDADLERLARSPRERGVNAVPMDRVCIVMMSAVGDAVHVLPVLTALKRHHPAMHVTWVLQPGPASLVRGHPASTRSSCSIARGAGAVRRRAPRARGPALRPRARPAGLLQGRHHHRLHARPVKLGFDRARARDANWLFTTHRIPPHAAARAGPVLRVREWLGVPTEPVTWDLGPWNETERAWQREFFARFDRPIAPIVVGTSKPQKDWLPERWAEVSDALYTTSGCSRCWWARARPGSCTPNA